MVDRRTGKQRWSKCRQVQWQAGDSWGKKEQKVNWEPGAKSSKNGIDTQTWDIPSQTFLFHEPKRSFCDFYISSLRSLKSSAAAKLLQSCPTLRDPMDCSLPGSSIHGIFQAGVLEWGLKSSTAVLFNRVDISHMWLFKLILAKIKTEFLSHTSYTLRAHQPPVASGYHTGQHRYKTQSSSYSSVGLNCFWG